MEHHLMRAQDHTRTIRAGHQCVHRRHLMVQPPTTKTNSHHNGCRYMAQAFVKVRTVLFWDMMTAVHRDLGQHPRIQ
tara:strand:- start:2058 stop:2288 length:231 start_codon:yes stop_codon:yes gene_type:complete